MSSLLAGKGLSEGRRGPAQPGRQPGQDTGRRKMGLARWTAGCAAGVQLREAGWRSHRGLDQSAHGFGHALQLLQDGVRGALVHKAPLCRKESSPGGDLRARENLERVLELVDLELAGLLALLVVLHEVV